MTDRPVRLILTDDLRRSRLTVFFRFFLALLPLIWLAILSIVTILVAFVAWIATLVVGRMPGGLHRFLSWYVRYSTQVYAYLLIAAEPWPGFSAAPGYPVDVEIDEPVQQNRWTVGFRIVLAIPAALLAATLAVIRFGSSGGLGVGGIAAFLGWFASLARGQMPDGLRNLIVYTLRYRAEVLAYQLLLTQRYPDSDPQLSPPPVAGTPPHPVEIVVTDDLRRSRLTVFFRLLLALPHVVWLELWTIVALLAAIVNWFVTLIAGRPATGLHRFLSAYVRYVAHVYAFVLLVANPFPGFAGAAGSYPVDVELPGPDRQNRWVTAFRVILALPAYLLLSGLNSALFVAALFMWFYALVRGRVPNGLRNLGAFVLRYQAQVNAYTYLLTDRYPYSGPVQRAPDASPPEQPAASLPSE